MNAVTAVEWPITFEFSEDSRYNTLLQISVGQEEVDEVIGRDINRTFPEHPQFGFEQGQQALYRVLKAYSLHDLEVGYCQVLAPPPPPPPPPHHPIHPEPRHYLPVQADSGLLPCSRKSISIAIRYACSA